MIEAMCRWRFTCGSCRVTKTVDVPKGTCPMCPEGWRIIAGMDDHLCEVCWLRVAEQAEQR